MSDTLQRISHPFVYTFSTLAEALLPTNDEIVADGSSPSGSNSETLDPEELATIRVLEPLHVDEEEYGAGTNQNFLGLLNRVVQWFLPEVSVNAEDAEENNMSTSNRLTESSEEQDLVERLSILLCGDHSSAFVKSAITLVLSIATLQVSYLIWGYQKELIMTTDFKPTDRVPNGRFPSAAFCVWTNRLAAVLVSSFVVFYQRGFSGSFQKSPLRAFSPCACSNTLSSLFQYSSLRLISFPVMMVSKSLKVVSVMIVGKLLNGTRYSWGEYMEAVVITIGVIIFSAASRFQALNDMGGSSLLGYLLILGFLFCDAFTSQWQRKIYNTYGRRNVDPFQMMMAVNLFAISFTSISLVASGEIGVVFDFLKENHVALKYLSKAAFASCVGQLCVFYVIREYGPVVFTVIMTTRQMMATVLSSIVFGHGLPLIALLGAAMVFATVAFQIRRNYSLARDPEVLQE